NSFGNFFRLNSATQFFSDLCFDSITGLPGNLDGQGYKMKIPDLHKLKDKLARKIFPQEIEFLQMGKKKPFLGLTTSGKNISRITFRKRRKPVQNKGCPLFRPA